MDFSSKIIFLNRHSQRDSLLISTDDGKIFELNDDNDVPKIQLICHQGSGYLFLFKINPSARNLGVIDHLDTLNIFEGQSGQFLGNLTLDKHGKSK